MAQTWVDFSDGIPSGWTVYGATTATIIADANAINGLALEMTRDLGSGGRGLQTDWPMTTTGVPVNEVLIRCRRAHDYVCQFQSGSGTTPRIDVWNGAVSVKRATSTVRDSYLHGLDQWAYFYLRFQLSLVDVVYKAKTWVTDEPASWNMEGDALDEGAPANPNMAIELSSFSSAPPIYIDFVSFGTDGDPAPTGPVGGARRRSPLLLAPW